MPVVMMYDIIVFKTSVFILSHVNEKLAFSKISSMGTVLENPHFWCLFMCEWKAELEKKISVYQTYQDMCGQGQTDDQK